MRKRRRSRGLAGLGEVTKKDFVAIANLLCVHKAPAQLVDDFATYFKTQNQRFDIPRFVAATKSCRVR